MTDHNIDHDYEPISDDEARSRNPQGLENLFRERTPHYGDMPYRDFNNVPAGTGGRHRKKSFLNEILSPAPVWTRVAIVLGLLSVLVALVFAGVTTVSRAIAPDPGIVFCEAIQDNANNPDNPDGPMGFDGYRDARKELSDSKHEEIRVPALAFIDAVWQLEGMGDDAGLEALPVITSALDAYASLSGGCANHGFELPPIEA